MTAASLVLAVALAALGLGLAAFAMFRARSVVHGAVLVMAALLAVAASMLALSAGFAAALMILVHAGAIVTVTLFVAVTLPSAMAAPHSRRASGPWPFLLLPPLALLLGAAFWAAGPQALPGPGRPSAEAVGALLFGPWAVAVELVSLMLLAALMGARILLRREGPGE